MKRILSALISAFLVLGAAAAFAEEPFTAPEEPAVQEAAAAGEELPVQEVPAAQEEQPMQEVPAAQEAPAAQEELPVQELPDAAEELPAAGEELPGQEASVPAPAEEPAAAEEPVFICGHENQETIRYFDDPVYTTQDELYHLVSGPAMINVVCDDCGAVLSSTRENYAEEIWPHVMHKGICVLCGYEQEMPAEEAAAPAAQAETAAVSVPQESVITLSSGGDLPGRFFCTLTGRDLESAADTLVLRPDGGDAAIVLETGKFLESVDRMGGSFTAEIWKTDSQDVSASVRLYAADGTENTSVGSGISLRIYRENTGSPLNVSYTDSQGSVSHAETRWVEGGGYWTVTWHGNGQYEY